MPGRISASLLKLLGSGGKNRDKYNTARFADINADGHDDLLLAISGDDANKATQYAGMRQSRIVLNDGSNHWLEENAIELPVRRWGYATHTTDIDAADLNNDGRLDLLLTEATVIDHKWVGQYHQLLLGDGSGGFRDIRAT